MPESDPIAEAARQNMPVTWDMLVSDPRVGEIVVQGRVAFVESKYLGVPIPDLSTIDPLVVEYLGLLAGVKVCDTAIDVYSNLTNSHTVSGEGAVQESENYGDRAAQCNDQKQRLLAQAIEMEPDVEPLFKFRTIRTSGGLPSLSSFNDAFLTSDPRELVGAYSGGQFGRGPSHTSGPQT